MASGRGIPPLVLNLVGLVALFATLPRPAAAQHPFTPGVGFGAQTFPLLGTPGTSSRIWAVQFDLFTELSKDLEPPPSTDFQRYNDIDRTIGVNQFGLTTVSHHQLAGPVSWHRAFWIAGGVVWDAPTELLQNDFAHGLRLLTFVPREGTVDHLVVGAGTDQTASIGTRLSSWLDVVGTGGVGAGLSTTWFDGYGQLGGRLGIGSNGTPCFQLGVLGRIGHVGDPFLWEGFGDGIDGWYRMVQGSVMLSLGDFFGVKVLPNVRAAFTRSRGPWVSAGGAPELVERLVSIRIESGSGQLAVEMWNDVGFKDLGPTFGLRVQFARTP